MAKKDKEEKKENFRFTINLFIYMNLKVKHFKKNFFKG